MPLAIDREVVLVKELQRREIQRLVEKGAQLVEMLPAEEFKEDHLPGAINIPLRKIESEANDRLDKSRPVIAYCWDSA